MTIEHLSQMTSAPTVCDLALPHQHASSTAIEIIYLMDAKFPMVFEMGQSLATNLSQAHMMLVTHSSSGV